MPSPLMSSTIDTSRLRSATATAVTTTDAVGTTEPVTKYLIITDKDAKNADDTVYCVGVEFGNTSAKITTDIHTIAK